MVHNKITPPHPSVSMLQSMEMIQPEFDCTQVNKDKTYVIRNNRITGEIKTLSRAAGAPSHQQELLWFLN
jgi:hypothetical protein